MSQFINGEWQHSGVTEMLSTDPSSGACIWSGYEATSMDVDAAINAATAAGPTWAMTALDDRMSIISRYADLVVRHKTALAELIAQDAGKTLWDAQGEATAIANKIDISLKAYLERTGEREALNGAVRATLAHRPHGVMAVFGPYNFPGHLPNGHIVPALIAGNTAVFKPSELTPAVAEMMVDLWDKAGVPKGVLNLVQGGRRVGEALVAHPDIDGVLITGSVGTGLAISRSLIDRPNVIQALEMGGNNPLIVHKAKDLNAAAMITVLSAYISSGQRCTCARRLIVPMGLDGDTFIEALATLIDHITVGAWNDTDQPFMGPLINADAAQAVLGAQDKMIAVGGTVIRKAQAMAKGDAFVAPGLIDVTHVKDRPDTEVFGPLLQVIRVEDFDAAIAEANNTQFGLASGLLSDDRDLFDYYYPRAKAGIVNWNQQLTGAASTAPFGGIGLSGNHRPSAYYAADYCSYAVAGMQQTDGAVLMPAIPMGIKNNP